MSVAKTSADSVRRRIERLRSEIERHEAEKSR